MRFLAPLLTSVCVLSPLVPLLASAQSLSANEADPSNTIQSSIASATDSSKEAAVNFSTGPLGATDLSQARAQTWAAWRAHGDAEGWNELWPEPIPATELQNGGQLEASSWKFDAGEMEHTLPFVVIVKGERPESGWPLFWCSHGGGRSDSAEGPHTWQVNTQEWFAQIQFAATDMYDSPGLYFVPRMLDDRRGRWWMDTEQEAWEQMMRVANLYGDIDPNRIYYLGISEGGYGSHRLAAFHGDKIAGAGPMAGCEPLENAPLENLRNTPFRMEIGEGDSMFDRNTLVNQVSDRLDQLAEENPGDYPHLVNVQQGRGHGIDYSPVGPWLAKQIRTPLPRHLTWVNWPLDGRRRQDFGWLVLTDLPSQPEDGRAVVDAIADAERNRVTITTEWRSTWNETGDPLKQGELTVFLSPELVDLAQPVTISIDGSQVYSGQLEPSWDALIASCQRYEDPERLMPTMITIDLATGQTK